MTDAPKTQPAAERPAEPLKKDNPPSRETGGPKGPDPTRYGDWEKRGRCIDF